MDAFNTSPRYNGIEYSNPTSPRYGEHLSADEVHDLFAPSDESVDQVLAWLESEGISGDRVSQSVNRQWIQFDASAEEMEKLLHTEYYLYSHAKSGRAHVACREYHVPEPVQSHIDYITPGIKSLEVRGPLRGKQSQNKRRSDVLPLDVRELPIPLAELKQENIVACDTVVTPACILVGRPTVGFVNPILYAHPEVFRDVTEGNNPGCGSDGFPAAVGWDPVTGLGTPIYLKLLELFMEM
ncbi:Pro-kumamolisin, activation domain-containing protein [Aspergillus varians]